MSGRVSRDGLDYDPGAPGGNVWSWTGEARPVEPGAVWRVGDPFTGDPPHERRGWSTLELIREYAARMAALRGSERAEEH